MRFAVGFVAGFTVRLRYFSILVFASILSGVLSFAAAQDYPKLAPFQAIEWLGGAEQPPTVTLDGETYELLEIDTLSVENIVAFSRGAYGDDWDKRIAEDLVQVLSEMDAPPRDTVTLLVRVPGEDEVRELSDVAMTEANRRAVWLMRHPEALARDTSREDMPRDTSPEGMLEDLDLFQEALETQFAYLHTNDYDYGSNLDALREEVRAGISVEEFGLGLERVIAGFIDGHAGVRGQGLPEDLKGYAPFHLNWAGERAVAVKLNRTDFLDASHPYLMAIDGVPLERWLGAASRYVANGSPQYVRRQALQRLRDIQFFRHELRLPLEPTLNLTLEDDAGKTTEQQVEVLDDLPYTPDAFRSQSRIVEGDIGYLRLESMDDDAVKEIHSWMPRFADTRGLIVDVRGNGGGSRDALINLFPHLMRAESAVVNVAKYRLAPEFDEDHLEAREMYRATHPGWTDAERRVVRAFAASFEPEWSPPEEDFSAWHYLLISRGNAEPYTAPVVVLLDAGGFSATDIFLGALAALPNVTLLGEASSGGSARSRRMELPNTGLEVSLASMASFRPDGRLYDGRGIKPDVEVQPSPSFFLQGGEDVVLERAVEMLSSTMR